MAEKKYKNKSMNEKMPQIFKEPGFAIPKDNPRLWIYRHVGVWMDKNFDKIRMCEVFRNPDGVLRFQMKNVKPDQKRYNNQIAIQAKDAKELRDAINQLMGEEGEVRERVEHTKEDSDVDQFFDENYDKSKDEEF